MTRYILIMLGVFLFACTANAQHERKIMELPHPSVPYMTQIVEMEQVDATHYTLKIKADNVMSDTDGRKYKDVRFRVEPGGPNELERYILDFSNAHEIDHRGNNSKRNNW